MKKLKRFIPVVVFILSGGYASAQVSDGFEDFNFTQNPVWVGDTGQFKINSAHLLQLKSTGSDTSFLSTQNSLIQNTEWQFWVKLSFNTSANNYARVYLASDHQDLTEPLNGYYLQIGGSNDSLGFFRQNGLSAEKLFQGSFTNTGHSTNVMRIKMVHDSTGMWHLFSDSTGGTNFIEEGNCSENQLKSSSWLGVYCRYTTSNSAKFYFDDFFAGTIQVDTTAPFVKSRNIINPNGLEIFFSENVDKGSAENLSHYSRSNSESPIAANLDPENPVRVSLTFQHDFDEGVFDTLTITDLVDLYGNHASNLRVPFCSYHVKSFDVLITEIMADPDPPVGLPAVEYVELFNRTKYPINLKDWVFQYGVHSKVIPMITIDPFGFLILTQGDSLLEFGRTVDLLSSGSSLTNDGTELILKDKSGRTIHGVSYSKSWYQSSFKEDGGWSLEMIDPNNPCGCRENWRASISPLGGTPGSRNSVHAENPDKDSPYLKRARIIPDREVEIHFSEPMDSLSIAGVNNWTIDHNFGSPDSLFFFPPDFSRLILKYHDPFQMGIQYEISCKKGPADCALNFLDTTKTILTALPDSIEPGDIIINEILPNPASGGERFVEIYNRSQKILDLKDILLASVDVVTGKLNKTSCLTITGLLSFPGDYFVLTKDPSDIQARYYSPDKDAFLQLETMPGYQDDNDEVVIARKWDEKIIDDVIYSKDMCFPLLNYTDGVSLERINPMGPSKEKSNWHSASESCGYGTPGYRNSQYREGSQPDGWQTINPLVFSPDNDGKDDFTCLVLHPDRAGYYVSITIFDVQGREVRQLVNNQLLSSVEQITWNGLDDNGQKAAIGRYLFYTEFIHPDGAKKVVKQVVIVAGNL